MSKELVIPLITIVVILAGIPVSSAAFYSSTGESFAPHSDTPPTLGETHSWTNTSSITKIGEYDLLIVRVIRTEDGGYLFAGVQRDNASDNGKPVLLKMDSNWRELWRQTYPTYGNGSTVNGDERIVDIFDTGEGYVLVTDKNSKPSNAPMQFSSRIIVTTVDGVKTDETLVGERFAENYHDVMRTQDGTYLLVGQIGFSRPTARATKIDRSGDVAWDKVYTSSPASVFHGVSMGYDGRYTISASVVRNESGSQEIIKLNESGNVVNVRPYNYTNTTFRSLEKIEGGYVLTGYSWRSGDGPSNHKSWVLKLDEQGNPTWQTVPETNISRSPGFPIVRDYAKTVLYLSEERYVILGKTTHVNRSKPLSQAVIRDRWIAVLDSSGDINYVMSDGSPTENVWITGVTITPDTFLAVGYEYGTGDELGKSQLFRIDFNDTSTTEREETVTSPAPKATSETTTNEIRATQPGFEALTTVVTILAIAVIGILKRR